LNYTRVEQELYIPLQGRLSIDYHYAKIVFMSEAITIKLNGEQRQFLSSVTVADLLAQLELAGRRVAVEVNLEIVPRSGYGECRLNTGDRVEVVQAIGGG